MGDCTTYPLTEIYRLRERLQRVETERDLLKKQLDRKQYKQDSWEHYCDNPEDFADGGF